MAWPRLRVCAIVFGATLLLGAGLLWCYLGDRHGPPGVAAPSGADTSPVSTPPLSDRSLSGASRGSEAQTETPKAASQGSRAARPENALGEASDLVDATMDAIHLPVRFYSLSGTVKDGTTSISDESLARFASAEGEEAFAEFLEMLEAQPVPNAVVLLKIGTVSHRTLTDPEGNFKFSRLQGGVYDLSCENAVETSNGRRMGTGKTRVDLRSDRRIWLDIRADYVTIEGRITDQQGRPVAGAKLTGKRSAPYNPQVGEIPLVEVLFARGQIPETTAVSESDGSYVLLGFEPSGVIRIARYLSDGRSKVLAHAEIHVEYPLLTQDKPHVTRVPLLTEESLGSAYRLLSTMTEIAQKRGEAGLEAKKDIALPSSHGNTITGVDIVLGQPE
jgi:hypothetical protein